MPVVVKIHVEILSCQCIRVAVVANIRAVIVGQELDLRTRLDVAQLVKLANQTRVYEVEEPGKRRYIQMAIRASLCNVVSRWLHLPQNKPSLQLSMSRRSSRLAATASLWRFSRGGPCSYFNDTYLFFNHVLVYRAKCVELLVICFACNVSTITYT